MRHNKFGDAYCHSAGEIYKCLDLNAAENDDGVYVASIDPPEGEFKATAEVVENGSGDTVCYIEADTVEAVRAIATEAGLDLSQI